MPRRIGRAVLLLPIFTSLLWAENKGKELCKQTFESYKARLEKSPEEHEAWVEFRICAAELKRWHEASEVSEAALTKNAQNADAHLLLGIARVQEKDFSKASASLNEAIRIKGDESLPYYYLGMSYLFQNKPTEAAAAAQKAVTLEPGNPSNHRQLAYAYLLLDDYAKCEVAAKKAIQLDRNDVASYKILAKLYAKMGRQADVDKALEEAMHANGRLAAVRPFVPDKVVAIPKPKAEASDDDEKPAEAVEEDPIVLCKMQWEKMKQTIMTGDFMQALLYFSDYADTREQYRQAFQRMAPRLKEMFSSFEELEDCHRVLESVICKATVTNKTGTARRATIRFERNSDAVWRIRSF